MTLPPGSICAPCRERGRKIPARTTGGVWNRYAMCLDCSLYRQHWQPPSHILHATRAWLTKRGPVLPIEIQAAIRCAPIDIPNVELKRRYGARMAKIAELRHATGLTTKGMDRYANQPGRRGWRGALDAANIARVAP